MLTADNATADPGRRRRYRLGLSQKKALYGWLYISPWVAGMSLFVIYPLVHSFWLSFRQLDSVQGLRTSWVGIKNYSEALLSDVRFVSYVTAALRDCIIHTPLIIIFSLAMALLANQKLRGRGVFKWVFFLGVVIGTGPVVQNIFGQGVGQRTSILATPGIADFIMYSLGPQAANVVFDLFSTLSFVLWRSGVQILLFIAGLNGMPISLYEAARCDGISEWELLWKITLPMLSPILWLNVVYTIVDGFTDSFNPTLHYIRTLAFSGQLRMGYSAAMGWIYFTGIFVLLMVVLRISKRYTFYAGDR